ncbi:hypothetical protein A9Q62_14205 [Yersinia ruckeri]|nr:Permease of the major facilitator superfamily [Yersinia ruckeri ATCC 29473]OJB77303.1 hypothetical protein A9Q62_14205 [Yersinia ruckeri]OJB81999.1 hypothetical protein A9Q60_13835 [Yersinia ruckeri]PHZ19754.1 DUF1435 domain-containing protein [Yersinia ruckeri]
MGVIMFAATMAACRSWWLNDYLLRRIASGWGALLLSACLPLLGWSSFSMTELRGIIVVAMLVTLLMLYHRRLRHFLLLPACLAMAGGVMAILMHMDIN